MATRQEMEQERLARAAGRERTSASTSSSNPSTSSVPAFKPADTSKPTSMTLSDLRKGGSKKGGGSGGGEGVLTAVEVASKGIALKLHPLIDSRIYEVISDDAVYIEAGGKTLLEDERISKAFVTTPPTNQVTVDFGLGGLPKSATSVKIERAQGVRILDLYRGMIEFVQHASSVESEEGDEVDLSEIFGEFELLYFTAPKKGSVELVAIRQD